MKLQIEEEKFQIKFEKDQREAQEMFERENNINKVKFLTALFILTHWIKRVVLLSHV